MLFKLKRDVLIMEIIQKIVYAITGGIYAILTFGSGLVFIMGLTAVTYGVASPELRDSVVSIGAPLKVLFYFGIGFILITLAVYDPQATDKQKRIKRLRIIGIIAIPFSFLVDFLGTAQAFDSYHIAALLSLFSLLYDTLANTSSPEEKEVIIVMNDEHPSKTHSWQEAWWKALAHPSVKTFADLSRDPTAGSNRAYKWIFIGWLISSLSALICAPFIAVIAVICTAISVLIISSVARCLKGTGTYKQLMFVMAAYSTPLAIIEEYITFREGIIPFAGYLSLFLFLYGVVLSVIAVKAVYQVSWLKSMIANFFLPAMLICSVVLIFVISSPQSALNIADDFMTALKNRDFSQFSFSAEAPVMQKWPTTIDKRLPIIKVDELISLIKEIDDSIQFEEVKGWRQIGDKRYDLVFHSCRKKFDNLNLRIDVSNRLGEDKFEHCEVAIDFPKGKFKLYEDKIKHLSGKYISGLVTKLVKEPKKLKEILSKKYTYEDPFVRMENELNPNMSTFFENYAYSLYQEDGPYSSDHPIEQTVLLIRIIDMYNREGAVRDFDEHTP